MVVSSAVPAYFALYERTFGLQVRRPVRARVVRDLGGSDRLLAVETVEHAVGEQASRTRARTWRTRAVVNATGMWSKPFWPACPGRERFEGEQVHARDVRSVDGLAGRRVMVVGGGASAVHLVQQLAPIAHTTWVARRPPERVVDVAGLPAVPGGGSAIGSAIGSGVPAPRPMFARLVPRGAVWTVGSVPAGEPTHVRADVIVWATGYRAALDHLAPLRLRARGGAIAMDGTEATRDRRIQLVGAGPGASAADANRAGREAVRNLRRSMGL